MMKDGRGTFINIKELVIVSQINNKALDVDVDTTTIALLWRFDLSERNYEDNRWSRIWRVAALEVYEQEEWRGSKRNILFSTFSRICIRGSDGPRSWLVF